MLDGGKHCVLPGVQVAIASPARRIPSRLVHASPAPHPLLSTPSSPQHRHEIEFRVTASFLQIYMEAILDLLNPTQVRIPPLSHPRAGFGRTRRRKDDGI